VEVRRTRPAQEAPGNRRSPGNLRSVADCIFCAIVAGEMPATIVDQDDDTVAFMDINPWAPGHTLVVPRQHSENLLEVDPKDLTSTFTMAKRIAARMQEGLGAEGMWLWNSCGQAAGQVVRHFHVHVIPTNGENVPPPPPPDTSIGEADIEAGAAALRSGT
jgi:histidine triad (HIT) family protein